MKKMAELDENHDDILLLNMYPLYPPDPPEFSRCLDPTIRSRGFPGEIQVAVDLVLP